MKTEHIEKTPKTFWNHRVVLDIDKNGHQFYSIRGVHYANYGKKIEGWDVEPLTLIFDQGDSISEYLYALQRACEKPVLRVEGDKLSNLGERPAEMFVGREGNFPPLYGSDLEVINNSN